MEILDRISMLLGEREQKELTNYLNLKSVAFSEWKSGKSKSYRKYLIEIATFFNVSLDYLVYGTETLTKTENELLLDFRTLSSQGQDYIKQQMFIAKEIYKKQDVSQANLNVG